MLTVFNISQDKDICYNTVWFVEKKKKHFVFNCSVRLKFK